MRISLLLTGNELMTGDTVDTNSAFIAKMLKDLSLVPQIKKVVGDELDLLAESINELASNSDVLIVNGGLGPTVDDLTALALSRATGSPLATHPQAKQELEAWSERAGFELTAANLKQANLPECCDVMSNTKGSAPGFYCDYRDCLIICTPGVPSELKAMVRESILPMLKTRFQLPPTQISRLRTFGIAESRLQEMLDEQFPGWPDEIELGFRVQMPVLEVKLTSVGTENQALNEEWTQKVRHFLADYVVGEGDRSLPEALVEALREHGYRLTTAESCTGGSIAAMVTSVAGSSAVFEAGFVTYSNTMKQQLLGIDKAIIEQHGAVSETVVREMAQGALAVSNADLAVAVSGIAGPDGGTAEKPVGTVWLAWGSQKNIKTRQYRLSTGRQQFQAIVSALALDLLRREALQLPSDPQYFSGMIKPAV